MDYDVSWCCPICKDAVSLEETAYSCTSCDATYPIVFGLPDFRTPHLTAIDRAEDLAKAQFLADRADQHSFEGLLRLYWESLPEITPERAEHFLRRAQALVEKGSGILTDIERLSDPRQPLTYGSVLEIGCGTGGFLVAASGRFERVVGTDVSLTWLVIARKRLEEEGIDVALTCASAEHLPFREGAVGLVVAEDVIEHVQDQGQTLQECARVLGSEGLLFLATPNRFNLMPEPHVSLWGVGFLPRRWMSRYVRWARGVTYDDIRVLSSFELAHKLTQAQFNRVRVDLPGLHEGEVAGFSPLKRALVPAYERLRRAAVARPFLLLFGPFFHVLAYDASEPFPADEVTE